MTRLLLSKHDHVCYLSDKAWCHVSCYFAVGSSLRDTRPSSLSSFGLSLLDFFPYSTISIPCAKNETHPLCALPKSASVVSTSRQFG